jgi:hypothetical protein
VYEKNKSNIRENKLSVKRAREMNQSRDAVYTFQAQFNIHHKVHISTQLDHKAAEVSARHAITMVHADNINNRIIVCIGASLHKCEPPETGLVLLAGCQEQNGFRDGPCSTARLSVVHGVAVDRHKCIVFTDWMNNCIREISCDGYVKTLYGALPVAPDMHGVYGFCDGYANQARFHRPWGICLCEQENALLVVDGCNSHVRHIDRLTAYVKTLPLQQDMAGHSITGEAVVPTQLLYPTTILVAQDDSFYVLNGSSHEILHIDIRTMMFRPVPHYHGVDTSYRPATIDMTPTGKLLVGYTGYDFKNRMRDTKHVSLCGTELWKATRHVIYYQHRSKLEICACFSLALAVNVRTHAATVWITDCCYSESRLLCVHLELKWSFYRVLLLAVLKPTHGCLLARLPMCTHQGRITCPILRHIVTILQGVCAFA